MAPGRLSRHQDGGYKNRDKFETCWKTAAAYHSWVQRKGNY